MAFEFFDYDPLTGVRTSIAWEDDKFHVRYEQDVTPILDFTKAMNAQGLGDESWRKTGATLYAAIPPVVQGALLKKGINFLNPDDMPRLLDEINTNYKHLKTTDKVHRIK